MFAVSDVRDGLVEFSWRGELSAADVVGAIADECYAASQAIGMGVMAYRDGALPDDSRELLVSAFSERGMLDMDYVHGRCCKLRVWHGGPAPYEAVPPEEGLRSLKCDVALFERDHLDVSFTELLSRVALRLEGEGGGEAERLPIEDVLEQCVLPLAQDDETTLEVRDSMAVITLGAPDAEFGDRAEKQYGGDLVRVGEKLVNVVPLRDRADEVRELAEGGDRLAMVAVLALGRQPMREGDEDAQVSEETR